VVNANSLASARHDREGAGRLVEQREELREQIDEGGG
jgi:hypothetical protein